MSDIPAKTTTENVLPAQGNPEAADQYLKKLIALADLDKLPLNHTDLTKFDPSNLQDHYRADLTDYEVEISHTKQAETGKDFYIMLFNNIKKIDTCPPQKVILSYIHLTSDQFKEFKTAAENYLERKRKREEEQRFKEAMSPIDNLLENLASGNIPTKEEIPASEEVIPEKFKAGTKLEENNEQHPEQTNPITVSV